MTDAPKPPAQASRRLFLRTTAAAAAAAPLAAHGEKLVQPTEHQLPARYQDSEHVQRFYALNRR